MVGKIISFDSKKGFGFILGEDDKKYFFHISNVSNPMDLEIGYRVIFTPEKDKKGLNAKNITIEIPFRKKDKWLRIDKLRLKASDIKEYEIYEDYDVRDAYMCFIIKIITYTSGIKKLYFCSSDDWDDDINEAREEAYKWLDYMDKELNDFV